MTTFRLVLCFSSLAFLLCPTAWGGPIWINEFHYDNAGADTGEFVEIVVAPDMMGPALSDVTLTLYNGATQISYDTHTLDTFVGGDLVNGFQFYWKLIAGIQNGAPDGMALSVTGTVLEFISYEGTFTASNGPANGLTSTDIGISEASTTPVGASLGLSGGPGAQASDFSWTVLSDDSPGSPNSGQSFVGVPEPSTIFLMSLAVAGLCLVKRRWR